jgi:hypothetical protein
MEEMRQRRTNRILLSHAAACSRKACVAGDLPAEAGLTCRKVAC